MPDRAIKVRYEGRQIQLDFDADKPILRLKEMLEGRTGLPIEQIKIYYSGPNREFDDDKTLRHYGLQFGGFFHMSDRRKDEPKQQQQQQKQPRRLSTPILSSVVVDNFEDTFAPKLQGSKQQRRNTTIAVPLSSSKVSPAPTTTTPPQQPEDENDDDKYSLQAEERQRLEAEKQAELAKQQIAAKKAAKKLKQRLHARKSISLPLQLPEETASVVEKIKKAKATTVAGGTKNKASPTGKNKRSSLPPLLTTAITPTASPPPTTIIIDVTTPNGTIIPLEVEPTTDTMDTLQEKIAKETGIAVPIQILKDTVTGAELLNTKEGETTLEMLNNNNNKSINNDTPTQLTVEIKKIPVTVRTKSGKEIDLLVDPTKDTIRDLKHQLEQDSGIPMDDQCLSLKGRELDDSDSNGKLAIDCGIEAGTVLDLQPKTITIDVVTPSGETVQIKVERTETTSSLQEIIAKETGVPVEYQDLTLDGKLMSIPKDTTPLNDIGIKDGSKIKVGIRKLPVTVRTGSGKDIQLMVNPTKDAIDDLKQQLEKESGIVVDNQCLSFEGSELGEASNPKLAIDCGIEAGSVLDLKPKTITFNVVTPTGETVQLQAKPTDTTESLQEKIAKEVGVPIAHQILTLDGNNIPTNNNTTLSEVGIKDGSVVNVGIQKLPVTVRASSGNDIQLMVDPTKDTIADLKRQLAKETGIPFDNQNLSVDGSEFKDPQKLASHCGIEAGTVLDLQPKTITIDVVTPSGETVQIKAKGTDTTQSLQERIAEEIGVPIDHQDLTLDGKLMSIPKDTTTTLNDIGFKDGSNVEVGIRKLPVTVRTGSGKELQLMVNPTKDTVEDLKKQLEKESGTAFDNQSLSLEGSELDEDSDQKLAIDCGIDAGSVLDLKPKTITVNVVTPMGEKVQVKAKPTDTSRSIKERLVREAGIPITQQILKVNGKEFPNFKTVKDMGLQDGSELSVDVLKVPVTVRTHDGNVIELMVNPSDDCISDLKRELEYASGFPASSQRLSMLGTELTDPDRTAGDCGILSGSVLDLEPQTITVGVKTPTGKTISLAIQPVDSIESVKERIAAETDLDVHQQVLQLNGRELDNSRKVAECGIQPGSLLDLCLDTITIAVETDSGTIRIQVKPSDTVETIKARVAEETGIAAPQLVLSFNGVQLAESETVDEIGAKDNSVLMLQRAQVQVTVNIPDGKQVDVLLDPNDTIEDLREKLEDESGIPRDEQKISLEGKELNDPSKTIQECNIKPGSFLTLERKRLEATAESQAKRLEEQKRSAAAMRRRSTQSQDEQPKPPELSEERKRKCYMWYARMAQPNRESMIRRVKQLDKSCDITVDDVEALPWLCGGSMLPVKEMNELFMNG